MGVVYESGKLDYIWVECADFFVDLIEILRGFLVVVVGDYEFGFSSALGDVFFIAEIYVYVGRFEFECFLIKFWLLM